MQASIEQIESDINNKDENGNTSLHLAIINNNIINVISLLESGADIEAKSNGNETPLFLAAEKGHFKIVELLIKGGANINAENNVNITSLFIAIARGHYEIVKLLVAEGAYTELNQPPQNLSTALSFAVFYQRIDILKFLLENRAYDPLDLKNLINDNNTAPDILRVLTSFQISLHHNEVELLRSEIALCSQDLTVLKFQFENQLDIIGELRSKVIEFEILKQFLIENRVISFEQAGGSADNSHRVSDIDMGLTGKQPPTNVPE